MGRRGYLYRYRFPLEVMRFAVILNVFLPSRFVVVLVFALFRAKVSHKTICDWSNKFNKYNGENSFDYSGIKHLICHVDEKFIKIAGKRAYWWTLKDFLGNIIHAIISMSRDLISAKLLFKNARIKTGRDVDLLVRDGCFSYEKATKCLGRKCKTLITGIRGKGVIYKKNIYWLTNNPAESVNSEIDTFLARFQYTFASLESAERHKNKFLLQKRLKKNFSEKKFLEASSTLEQAFMI